MENVNLRQVGTPIGLDFNEDTHTYKLNGKELISTTTLLTKHHLSPSYGGVDEKTLDKAREYGNQVHKEIEDYVKHGIITNSIELSSFIKWLNTSGYEVVDSEYLVCNDIIGGKVDLLLKHKETGVYVICDIKTTSIIHKESVSWQVSIYNYLDEDIALVGMCLHFLKDGSIEAESIPLKAPKDIARLIECERNGELFQYEITGLDNAISKVSELENVIATYKAFIKQAEEDEKLLHEQIRQEMENRNIKSLDLDTMKITIVEDSVRKSIDTKKLEQEQPIIYEKYLKQTIVKGGLRITLKGKKDETKTD